MPAALPVPLPNAPRGVMAQDHERFPYTIFQIVVNYHWNEGKLAAPLAKANAGHYRTPRTNRSRVRVIQKDGGHGTKVVRFQVGRWGDLPILPSPDPTNEYEVLDDVDISANNPQPSADGRQLWTGFHGTYRYILTVPLTQYDGIPIPQSGVLKPGALNVPLSKARFVKGLI